MEHKTTNLALVILFILVVLVSARIINRHISGVEILQSGLNYIVCPKGAN